MPDPRVSQLPTEVELVYEVMPCNAMRVAQGRPGWPHSCSYFRDWGTYHSYDYTFERAPGEAGILHSSEYVGKRALLPELVSGCRKAPIMAVGINPNLPAWWQSKRNSVYPHFDDYRQYAHYFRYRAIHKLELSDADYERFSQGIEDEPLGDEELEVPTDDEGRRPIALRPQAQKMYEAYEDILLRLAEAAGWEDHSLAVGEDLSYGNMVACPSAKWVTRPAGDLPVMSRAQLKGIVCECFRERSYFLRQLFQSLPRVLLVFSRSTARAFIGEMRERFVEGDPHPDESLEALRSRTVRLEYGSASDGAPLGARVIFAPHVTGTPEQYGPARDSVVAALSEEVDLGHLSLNPETGHLDRPRGACILCPFLEIGPCDYEEELEPLSDAPKLSSRSAVADLLAEKREQDRLLEENTAGGGDIELWSGGEDTVDEEA